MRSLLLLILLVGVPRGVARGEPAEGRAAVQARSEYEKGRRAYDLGQFDQAIAAFTRAYELDPAPMLLFNLAQSHWKKGDNQQALSLYRRYLDADPRTEQRSRVEARIRELEAAPAPSAPPPLATVPLPGASGSVPDPGRAEELPRAGVLPAVADARTQASVATPLVRRPWFWAAVGGLVVGAAAVALAVRTDHTMLWDCGRVCPFGTYPVKDRAP